MEKKEKVKRRTEKEWLEAYHKCCNAFGDKWHTGNRVRLTLGQFRNDDNWGFIEIISYNTKTLKKLISICENNNLGFDFSVEIIHLK